MPTYEYMCKNCGETLEVFQRFSDKPLKRHEQCGGDLQKVFHARGIVFKGEGFYATDARRSAASSSDGNDSKKDKTERPAKSDKPKAAATATAKSDD